MTQITIRVDEDEQNADWLRNAHGTREGEAAALARAMAELAREKALGQPASPNDEQGAE